MVLELYKTEEKKRPRGGQWLILLFRVNRREEREAVEFFRDAFGVMAYPEVITENLTALHVLPGHPSCLRDGGAPR